MTETYFVDTNVFVRYLTGDDEGKAKAVRAVLLKAKSGKIRLVTSELVIAELVWVLKSYYGLADKVIAELVEAVLNTEGLAVENELVIRDGVNIFIDNGVDFVDAIIIASMRKNGMIKLLSFDKKHMARFPDLELIKP